MARVLGGSETRNPSRATLPPRADRCPARAQTPTNGYPLISQQTKRQYNSPTYIALTPVFRKINILIEKRHAIEA
ncbi:unnamed protein product, partial [Iphiclides podalirius]